MHKVTQLPSPDRVTFYPAQGGFVDMDSYAEVTNLAARHSYTIERSYSSVMIKVNSRRYSLYLSSHERAQRFYDGFILNYPRAIPLD